MNTALIGVLAALAISATGCGSAAPAGSTTETLDSSREQQAHAQGRKPAAGSASSTPAGPQMPTEIRLFHDTLAPHWHAPAGPQRIADTCGVIGQLSVEATAIVDAAAPAGADAQAWTDSGKQLDDAVITLGAACRANDSAGFETAFVGVHTSFHRVMDAAGTGEHEHEGHDEAAPAPEK